VEKKVLPEAEGDESDPSSESGYDHTTTKRGWGIQGDSMVLDLKIKKVQLMLEDKNTDGLVGSNKEVKQVKEVSVIF
jgi:hypothetical protein